MITDRITRRPASVLRNTRGVALPVALFGLVAVSLLVTTALLTSGTESAISFAQTNATRSLYAAETGLKTHLLQTVQANAGLQAGTSIVELGNGAGSVRVTTARLAHVDLSEEHFVQTFSLVAEPMRNNRPLGRAVVAMVEQGARFSTLDLDIEEGMVVGGDLRMRGASRIIDRSEACADTAGAGAVRHADGSVVDDGGGGQERIIGEVREADTSGEAFVDQILRGRSLHDLAQIADVKFGPAFRTENYTHGTRVNHTNADERYNWGCPAGMGVGCPAGAAADYKLIAIDASELNNRIAQIQGDWGQGILIVINGGLSITGNFQFKGILLIEGNIEITGTGGNTGSKVEGAVVAFGEGTSGRSEIHESQTLGHAVISYNRCAVNEAQDAFNRNAYENPTFSAPQPTFAWFELVR